MKKRENKREQEKRERDRKERLREGQRGQKQIKHVWAWTYI